jgi:flagellar hook-associated protein 3 FlgL
MSIAREQSLYSGYASGSLTTLRRDLAQLQEQIGTGKRINRPSDDPTGFAQARTLEALEQRYDQYNRTIGSARLWTDRTQSALDGLAERFAEAHEKGLQGLNDTNSQDERNVLADRIDAILGEVIDGLNAKSGSEYLFGGTRTTTPPLQEDGTLTGSDNVPPDPVITVDDLTGERKREIAPGVTVTINVSGKDVLQSGSDYTIVDSLKNLAAALRGEVDDPDLQTAVAQVEVSRDHLIERGADAGNVASRLTLAETQIADATIETASRRSAIEDADYYDVVQRFQSAQTALEAALRTTASVSQTTLLDYLR